MLFAMLFGNAFCWTVFLCCSMLFYAVRLCAAMLFCYAGIQSKSMRFNGIQRRPMQSIGVRV